MTECTNNMDLLVEKARLERDIEMTRQQAFKAISTIFMWTAIMVTLIVVLGPWQTLTH